MATLTLSLLIIITTFSMLCKTNHASSLQHGAKISFASLPQNQAIPANPEDIHFYLFTSQNTEVYDEIFNSTESIVNSHWQRNASVKISVHGFGESWNTGSGAAMKDGYITQSGYPGDVNLVLVQWQLLATIPHYLIAVNSTKLVGEKVAYLVQFLIENQFTTASNIHLLGHSLGSHAVGFAGKIFQDISTGNILPRITGLDPAWPLFGGVEESQRLHSTDAEIVDVIHTAAGRSFAGEFATAFIEPLGTIDFYPNSGKFQPGCSGSLPEVSACSHFRSYEYFAESIHRNGFAAVKCNNDAWDPEGSDNFSSCSADKGQTDMGEWTNGTETGIYYLQTNAQPPFGLN